MQINRQTEMNLTRLSQMNECILRQNWGYARELINEWQMDDALGDDPSDWQVIEQTQEETANDE